MHACAGRPPGPAGAPVIAAAKRLKLTGAATLDLRHFTAARPPHTAALNLLPPTPAAQPARHPTGQPVTPRHRTLTTLGSPNHHYARLLLPGAGPTQACRSR